MKRVIPFTVCLILLTSSVSAAVSITEMLDYINPETMILFLVFAICLILLSLAFNRIKLFKENRASSVILSLLLSFAATYGLYKSNLDISDWFYDIGIPLEFLYILLPIIGIIIGVMLYNKFKIKALIIIGALFIFSAFFVYEKEVMVIIGIILVITGLAVKKKPKPTH